MLNKRTFGVAGLLFGLCSSGWGATLVVSGQANLFGAGKLVPPAPGTHGGGVLPPVYAFAAGPDQVLIVTNVTGLIEGAPSSFAPPEGVPHLVNALPYDGISGIISPVAVPLAGVFLGPEEPLDPAPPSLDFRAAGLGLNFAELAPVIGQLFIIGDGLTGTGTGTRQVFHVPPTATRLFLGIFDGYHLGDGTPRLPGYYGDNSGAFSASFQVFARPNLALARNEEGWLLHWPAETGMNYQVLVSDLQPGSGWSPVGDPVSGSEQPATLRVPTTVAPSWRFFRLLMEPEE